MRSTSGVFSDIFNIQSFTSLLELSRNQGLKAGFPAWESLALFHQEHGSGVPKPLETSRSLGIMGTFLKPFPLAGGCADSNFLAVKLTF